MTLIESSLPHHSLWSPLAIKYASAYYGLVTVYTVIVTTIMVARILSVRRNFMKATGTSECDAQYLSVAAMIVESSALYTIWGIIFLVLFVVDSPIVDVFVATLSEVQVRINPQLLCYLYWLTRIQPQSDHCTPPDNVSGLTRQGMGARYGCQPHDIRSLSRPSLS